MKTEYLLENLKIQNSELYEAYKEFVRNAISSLQDDFGIINIINSHSERDTTTSIGSTIHSSPINLVRSYISAKQEEIKSMPEYDKCKQLMDKDEQISKQVNKMYTILGLIQPIDHWTYISHFLVILVNSLLKSDNFDEDRFNELYFDLEDFFYNDSVEMLEIAPLYNFTIVGKDNDNISSCFPLSEGLSIRKITDSERELVGRFSNVSSTLPRNSIMDYVIEYKYILSKGFESDYDTQKKEHPSNTLGIFSSVITALRLFQEGDIGIFIIPQKFALDLPMWTNSLNVSELNLHSHMGVRYVVDKNQMAEFRLFWNSYEKLLIGEILNYKRFKGDKFKNIKSCFERFNSAYSKTSGDKFVDYVISLEALFSKKDDPRDGMTHRLALRSSRFLANDIDGRKQIYDDIKDLYGERSSIVHGSEEADIDIIKMRGYMRKCIKKYLSLALEQKDSYTHEEMINSIDFS